MQETNNHDILVIGTSAGGVTTLQHLVRDLPRDLGATVFIVIHMSRQGAGNLPDILNRSGTIPVSYATDGEGFQRGRIYIAPSNRHLIIGKGFIRLSAGARVNRSRPAIDPTFQSAAMAYGPRVAGVLLSGALDDGTRGLATIKRYGGVTLVQDPADASYPDMPQNAIDNVEVDYVLPLHDIASTLIRLAPDAAREVPSIAGAAHNPTDETGAEATEPMSISPFSCPECGGPLWEVEDGTLFHYRCRVGHEYSPSNLLAGQTDAVEAMLWSALRAMDERQDSYRRIVAHARERDHSQTVTRFEEKILTSEHHASLIRQILDEQ